MSKAFALGAVLIVAGVMWRAVVAKRRRVRVLDGMGSPDASVRAAAMRRISRTGVAEYAGGISSLVASTHDPIRQGELAWLIASTQWEPARDPEVAQLRLWADNYYRARQGVGVAASHDAGEPGVVTASSQVPVSGGPPARGPAPLAAVARTGALNPATVGPAELHSAPSPPPPPAADGLVAPVAAFAPVVRAAAPAPSSPERLTHDGSHRAPSSSPSHPHSRGAAAPREGLAMASPDADPPQGEPPRPAMVELAEAYLGTPVLWLRYEPAGDGNRC